MTFPTSSKTALLLQCGWAFGPREHPAGEPPGEAALYGTAYHEVAAEMLGCEEPPAESPFLAEAQAHAALTIPRLKDWLEEREFRTPAEMVEVSWLYNVKSGWVRRAVLDKPTHRYVGQGAHDMGGTVDFASWRMADRRLLVLDHKTGQNDPGDPAEHPQLLTLAVMAAAHCKRPQAVTVALHWAPRGSTHSEIRAKSLSLGRLELHAADLRRAFDELGSGRLRPGPECEHCPARHICPTRTNALALFTPAETALARPWTPDEAAFVHERLAVYRDMARMLERKIRTTIEERGEGLRPDGKVVRLVSRPSSNLSMASIRRALPKDEAEALIDDLGAKGCIETTERVELRAFNANAKGKGTSND